MVLVGTEGGMSSTVWEGSKWWLGVGNACTSHALLPSPMWMNLEYWSWRYGSSEMGRFLKWSMRSWRDVKPLWVPVSSYRPESFLSIVKCAIPSGCFRDSEKQPTFVLLSLTREQPLLVCSSRSSAVSRVIPAWYHTSLASSTGNPTSYVGADSWGWETAVERVFFCYTLEYYEMCVVAKCVE